MHYVWVGYTIVQQGGQFVPKDMFMESSYSDDGGATWAAGTKVTTTTDNASGTLLLDKPWVTVSPDAAQTLLINFSVGDNTQQHMFAAVSEDHGLSWRPKVQIENGDNNHGHNLGMPVFDPSDTTGNTVYDVFITYTQVEAGASNYVSLVKSVDRGKTWSQPMVVSAADDQVLFEPPSISADKSHHLYVGYTSSAGAAGKGGAKYWDAMVATVDVSGSTPVVARRTRASDDQGGCFQHFHVMTAVDPATGKVFAGWLDNRQGGKGGTWYSVSSDGGATWSANKLVSDATFTFNPDHQNAQLNFLGDYFGFIWDGSKLRIAWSDPRNGSESQVFYAGGAP
jgi:Neuraminidase (sialidase)